jgi:hypothetical protein
MRRLLHGKRVDGVWSLVCVAIVMLLGGCGTPLAASPTARIALVNSGAPPASPGVSATFTPIATGVVTDVTSTTAPDAALLAALRGTTALTITDLWWVLGPVQRVTMVFTLRRTSSGFDGTGEYTAESYYGPKTSTKRQIAIPQAAIKGFFTTLAAAPRREGAYTPKVTHTDYSPDLSIDLMTPNGAIAYRSQSQGETHVPWQAQLGGRSYVVDSPAPMVALESLEPFLQRSATIKALTVTIDATLTARPTEPPFVPILCRTPVAGTPRATPFSVPTAAPQATRSASGAQPRIGDTINLVEYFGLAGTTFVSVGGNVAPFSVRDRQQIAEIIAALDHTAPIIAQPEVARGADILLTIDAKGKPISFGYSTTLELIAFSADGRNYATPAPPTFRDIWINLICTRSR